MKIKRYIVKEYRGIFEEILNFFSKEEENYVSFIASVRHKTYPEIAIRREALDDLIKNGNIRNLKEDFILAIRDELLKNKNAKIESVARVLRTSTTLIKDVIRELHGKTAILNAQRSTEIVREKLSLEDLAQKACIERRAMRDSKLSDSQAAILKEAIETFCNGLQYKKIGELVGMPKYRVETCCLEYATDHGFDSYYEMYVKTVGGIDDIYDDDPSIPTVEQPQWYKEELTPNGYIGMNLREGDWERYLAIYKKKRLGIGYYQSRNYGVQAIQPTRILSK